MATKQKRVGGKAGVALRRSDAQSVKRYRPLVFSWLHDGRIFPGHMETLQMFELTDETTWSIVHEPFTNDAVHAAREHVPR